MLNWSCKFWLFMWIRKALNTFLFLFGVYTSRHDRESPHTSAKCVCFSNICECMCPSESVYSIDSEHSSELPPFIHSGLQAGTSSVWKSETQRWNGPYFLSRFIDFTNFMCFSALSLLELIWKYSLALSAAPASPWGLVAGWALAWARSGVAR